MRIKGKLELYLVCDDATHEEFGEESLVGKIVKHSVGWRFDPADDWTLSAKNMAKITEILKALE